MFLVDKYIPKVSSLSHRVHLKICIVDMLHILSRSARYRIRSYLTPPRSSTLSQVQAMWRSRRPYFGFQEYKHHTLRHRKAIVIQCLFRRFLQVRRRLRRLQAEKFRRYKIRCATNIQRSYRGMVGRRRVKDARDEKANRDLRQAKRRALMEVKATMIQCCFHGRVARDRVAYLREQRRLRLERLALEQRSSCLLQRIARGYIGRCRAYWRRQELLHAKLR